MTQSTNPLDYSWWLASRAAGVTSLVLVSLSVLLGLAMAAGLIRRPAWKRTAIALHEQVALAGLVAIAVHGITLLGDTWLKAAPIDLVVPFGMGYRPGFTGLGVIAGWLAALLGLSFYARKWIGAKRWRSLHRATLLVWLLGAVHTLGAGTDAGSAWLQALVAAPAVAIALMLPARLLRGRRRAAGRLARGGTRSRRPAVPAQSTGGGAPRRPARGPTSGGRGAVGSGSVAAAAAHPAAARPAAARPAAARPAAARPAAARPARPGPAGEWSDIEWVGRRR